MKRKLKKIKELSKEYQMSTFSELKWFLEIYVLYNCSQRLLWLSQETYIKKIANQYKIDFNRCLPDTFIADTKLLFTNHQLIYLMFLSLNTDLLVCPKSLLKEPAFTILY